MFVVYSFYFSNGLPVFQTFGPFASASAAEGWVAAQTNPANYLVASAWNPTPAVAGGPLSPATVAVGQWVVGFVGTNLNGTFTVLFYGGFVSQQTAMTYQATLFPPTSYGVSQVIAPA
jgi:hypothetical protein